MITHYTMLLLRYWRVIALSALAAGALAASLSVVLLRVSPVYESRVTMNLQPSEEALRFNRNFLGVSQLNPADIITQAHVERLLSRPVAERAMAILTEDGGVPVQTPDALDDLVETLRRNWALLNYGYFSPPNERDAALNDLIAAVDVEVVAGSYILSIEVSHEEPTVAARAANAMARAFLELSSSEATQEARKVDRAIADLQNAKRDELVALQRRRRALDREFGAEDLDAARAFAIAARTEARESLKASEERVARLRERASAVSGRDSVPTDALHEELSAAERDAGVSAEALALAERRLIELDQSESRRSDIDQQIGAIERDLEDLQQRRIAAKLAQTAQLGVVRIIDNAEPPAYPSFPKVLVNTVVGTVVGAMLALALIVMLDVLDDRVRTSDDLRQSADRRTMPAISPRLFRQSRRFLRSGARPGAALKAFAEAVGRLFLTVGPGRRPNCTIYVTAFGDRDDVLRLHAAIDAALRIIAPKEHAPTVAALPPLAHLGDWSACRDAQVVIGVPAGEVNRSEVEHIAAAGLPGKPSMLFAVLS